jgi:hypothetical protein
MLIERIFQMMSDGRCGERYEVAGAYFHFFFIDFRNAAAREDIKSLFFVLVRVVHKGFLPGGYARDAHACSLQTERAAQLHADQSRCRIPG